MPLVNSEKNAQRGKLLKEVDTTSEIYQLFESNFSASDRKWHNFKLGIGDWGLGIGHRALVISPLLPLLPLLPTESDDRQTRSCNLLRRVR